MGARQTVGLSLAGKAVIVTGAARGIGEAIAREFGNLGCRVAIVDRMRRQDGRNRCDALAQHIRRAGGDAFVMKLDVSDRNQVENLIRLTVERFGRVDVFVNNAAVMKGGSILSMDEKNLQEHFDVNVKGAFNCCQLAAKQMITQGGGGRIIIISSIDGMEAEEGIVAYSSSKASLIMMTKCMAVELASHGITVNTIAPGWVETDMTVPYLNDALMKELAKRIPLGRMAKPEEIAGGVIFLASSLADYVTGHVLVIDGGLTSNITIKNEQSAVTY